MNHVWRNETSCDSWMQADRRHCENPEERCWGPSTGSRGNCGGPFSEDLEMGEPGAGHLEAGWGRWGVCAEMSSRHPWERAALRHEMQ